MTDTTLVMPAVSDVKVGTEGRFIVQLADKTEVMNGRCTVEELKPAGSGAASRPIMRLRLLDLDEASRKVHARLLAAKRPAPAPPPLPAPVPRKPPPLRIVPAPTLIGVGAPPVVLPQAPPPTLAMQAAHAAQVAHAAEAAPMPIAEDKIEPTERSRWLAAGQRAAGAALTLPANPLSELGEGDLASFIDCTLFESSGEPSAGNDTDDEKTAGPVALEAAATLPAMLLPTAAPPPPATPPRATPLRSAPAVDPLASTPPPVLQEQPAPPLRRGLVRAAPYALCTVVGVLVGAFLRGSPRPPPPPVAVAQATPVPTPAAPAAPVAPAPPVAEEPAAPAVAEAKPAAPTARPATGAAAGECMASITTEPADATVIWGDHELGRAPIRGARVPCGAATLVLRHERYKDVEREVSAAPGSPASVTERLKRPMATLALSSTPAHATFKLNERELGAGPRNISVMRFEHLQVEASLPGFKPWSQTVYIKEPSAKVVAQLVAIPKPAARPVLRNVPARPAAAPTFRR